MKKEIKVVLVVLVALIVFLSGFGLGSTQGININVNYQGGAQQVAGTAAPAPATTAAPTTAAPTTAAPTTAAPAPADTTAAPAPADTTAAPDTTAPSNTTVPSTPAEIATAYNKAVNDYRKFTGRVTLKKTEVIDIKANDVPDVVNKVVEKFTGTTTEEFTFDNGVDVNDPARYIDHKMIPGGRDAAVDPAGLASATATANADGGYTIKIKFVSEKSDFDGTNTTSNPTYHMGAMDPLNLGTLDISPLKISSANMTYPGAETELTVDAQGRLVKLHNYLPLEGTGSGGVGPIQLTISISGAMDATYEMTYA